MSVYTVVERGALAEWLAPLGLGELIDHAGIAAGMQNSNYFVTTTAGRYVLTLFEAIPPAELDFYLQLQETLADRGLPCPQPQRDASGRRWRLLAGKPAALLSRLAGQPVENPSVAQCAALGAMLARLHLAAADFRGAPPNPCGAAWCAEQGQALLPLLATEDAALLADELAFQAQQSTATLPGGVIHADLFRDNALWDAHGQLAGVLDFYFAGVDCWLFDLAVVVNDWCPDAARFAALCAGYAECRPLTLAEQLAWPAVRRLAALRFWLLRLDAKYRPRPGSVVTVKNPETFRDLLQHIRLAPGALPG
ncbi:MAG: homoserine kinase [Azonexus sp.]|nr:homoserine kinase [Azonexus sp.]